MQRSARPRFVARHLAAACLCGSVFVAPAIAEDAKPKPAEAAAAPASPAPAKRPETRVVHPQVNMAGFSREYRAIPMQSSPADEAIRTALRAPMRRLRDCAETPLRAVLSELQDETGLPIVCDMQALADAGIDLDQTTVTQELTRMPGVSLAAALRLLLRDAGLTWVVGNEVLTVTTREKAQENLVVVAYPLPRGFGDARPVDFQPMIDLIQSTVAAPTWDTVGGPGAIRPLESAGEPLLVVSQTSEIHNEVENILRRVHERLLAEFAAGRPVLRTHHVADDDDRSSLADSLKDLCNASLGDRGDDEAQVVIVGDSVSVLSKSPEFHALAAQTIAAVGGVVEPLPLGLMQGGMSAGGNPFCWVAREIYGVGDPRWLVFRGWMVDEAPRWLRDAYAAVGPDVAAWLRGRPVAKTALRRLMDAVVEPRLAGAGVRTGTALP